jgi:serine-type D-Ala-D-Ala carboxypeptidase/endopeptidase (penicillin-binding protein 4)
MKHKDTTTNIPKLNAVANLMIALGAAVSFAAPSASSPSGLSKEIQKKFESKIRGSAILKSDIGIWVGHKLATGEVETLFENQSKQVMIPASLSKLITASAGLKNLPPGFKFKTKLASLKPVSGPVLSGPLYLIGGGDPSFISETMWFLVNEFRRTGVRKIEGDIIVDESRFDAVKYDEDRQSQRVDRAYDAPVGAMSMNWNSASVSVRPGLKAGDPCGVFVDIESPYIILKNLCKTKSSGSQSLKSTVTIERRLADPKTNAIDEVIVSGTAAVSASEITIYKNISQPALWSGYNLREFLAQRGITVGGIVKQGTVPSGAHELASADSKPIADIIADMSKWSNNYVAEMITKNIAAEKGIRPATMEAGLKEIRKYLDSLNIEGMNSEEFKFVNPAGFTRDNQMTAQVLGRFLERVQSEFGFFPEMLSSLPIAGVDGTLKSRMKGTPAERLVRAKTGLLNGVAGLAGYAAGPAGQMLSFAMIYNGKAGAEESARHLFDGLAAELAEASQN